MANEQNLTKKGKARGLTTEEAQKIGKKGGIASGKSRAIAKTFRETIDCEMSDDDLKKIINRVIKEAQKGNMKAVELLRDTRGEKPVERFQEIETPTISDDI